MRKQTKITVGLTLILGLLAAALMIPTGADAGKKKGTQRADNLVGTAKADKLSGRGGKDKLKGRGGADRLKGGRGADRVLGGGGRDRLTGGKGADRVVGGGGKDRLVGGKGTDKLVSGASGDLIRAADGKRDRKINGGRGTDRCVIDTALELEKTRGCENVLNGPNSPGVGSTVPGLGQLTTVVEEVTGLVCSVGQQCELDVTLDTSQVLTGPLALDVEDLAGLELVSGLNLNAEAGLLHLSGSYQCSEDGLLRLRLLNSEVIALPIDCGGDLPNVN